jgi:hypothetical protein
VYISRETCGGFVVNVVFRVFTRQATMAMGRLAGSMLAPETDWPQSKTSGAIVCVWSQGLYLERFRVG